MLLCRKIKACCLAGPNEQHYLTLIFLDIDMAKSKVDREWHGGDLGVFIVLDDQGDASDQSLFHAEKNYQDRCAVLCFNKPQRTKSDEASRQQTGTILALFGRRLILCPTLIRSEKTLLDQLSGEAGRVFFFLYFSLMK